MIRGAAAPLLLMLALTACGAGEGEADNGQNAAAVVEPTPVPGQPTPVTPATTLPGGDGIPGVSAPPPGNSVAAPPGNSVDREAGPEAAVAVVRGYFAAVDQGRFEEAYRLWDDRGGRSGMTAKAFADSFRRYDGYRASIGTPGRIDAGAGQRYITIPVRIDGQLRGGGGNFTLAGPVVLHRAGDIDGATAEQRSWRIYDTDLKPRPVTAASAVQPRSVGARYRCDDGSAFLAVFDNEADTVRLRRGTTQAVTLSGRRPASGIWYRGEGHELRGKGDEAVLGLPGGRQLRCTA